MEIKTHLGYFFCDLYFLFLFLLLLDKTALLRKSKRVGWDCSDLYQIGYLDILH